MSILLKVTVNGFTETKDDWKGDSSDFPMTSSFPLPRTTTDGYNLPTQLKLARIA